MKYLGLDIGTSSIKGSVIDASTGNMVASAQFPKIEAEIIAKKAGWAEQDPENWWASILEVFKELGSKMNLKEIEGIGISYQMHGLVCVDKDQKVLRHSIIWCDSRAVSIGQKAFDEIGHTECLSEMLNSPGNFTASKLKWVKENEPELYAKIDKIMLPGDFAAMKLTGQITTTVSGLSEGIFWDFKNNEISKRLMKYYGFSESFIPAIVDTFAVQGTVSDFMANEIGLKKGVKVSYRAGDQPNNAFSLNVLKPGEIAATAGTSGVVYGVTDKVSYDPKSRINTFGHVNHTSANKRLGVLLCVNGTGSQNSWTKRIAGVNLDYPEMNGMAQDIPIGSEGLVVLPFGNGAERMLENKVIGTQLCNINLNNHGKGHIFRAVQEGIVFALKYGMDIMKSELGVQPKVIRAGKANMFLSPIFRETLMGVTGVGIELYETDGALGAARGAAYGAGFYKSEEEAFETLQKVSDFYPIENKINQYNEAYNTWKNTMSKFV